jgi:hypothetical protein
LFVFSLAERSGRCLNFLSFPSHQTHVSLLPSVEATVPWKIERNSRIEKKGIDKRLLFPA